MLPNTIVTNRACSRKVIEREYKGHMNRIKEIKPIINNQATNFTNLFKRLHKQNNKNTNKIIEIKKENGILLNKIF